MADIARREYPSPDRRGATLRNALLGDAEALARYLSPLLLPLPDLDSQEVYSDLEVTPSGMLVPGMARGLAARHAAVLAPLYARDGEPWLLFTRRASGLSRHSGEISFPGGSRDPGDASLAHTALRETHEELALDTSQVRLLGALPEVYASVSNFLVTTYVGWLGEGLPELTPAHGEVAEVIEAPLSALDDPAIYHEEVWSRGGAAHTVMFYDFGVYRIWGLTGRLLHHLLSLLPPREEPGA
ncbi:MAG TPA: CoA pyrophosphatase [Ktedonobacterales bacterium]|nr:CoA pyrophosphatase [Ktedonobacterales bacterium]